MKEQAMHKNLLGVAAVISSCAALVLAGAVFIHVLPSSQAQDFGPVVTGGEAPLLAFAGTVTGSQAVDVYTVPADRMFVVTALCTNAPELDVRELGTSNTLKVKAYSYATRCASTDTGGFLSRGRGTIPFGPGTTVRLDNQSGSNVYYTLQGYLAAP
jgi:hypothetical protein